MTRYIIGRIGALLPTIIVPMVVLFIVVRLIPGDPAAVILGEQATIDQVEALRAELGLDQPLILQFGTWVGQMLQFQLGDSIFLHESVATLVLEAAAVTSLLTAGGMILGLLLAVPAGIASAARHDGRLDRSLNGVFSFLMSVPDFWIAIILVGIFGVTLGMFPVVGWVSPTEDMAGFFWHLFLPALALGIAITPALFRYSRMGVLDAINSPFVTTARSQGLPENTVITQYVNKLALLPVLTVSGLIVTSLLGGAVVIEIVFSLPGLGQLLLTAVNRRDYPLIEGCVLFIAIIFVVVNLLIDIAYAIVDPRIRYTSK